MKARILIVAGALALFGCVDVPPPPTPVAQRTVTPETPQTPEQQERSMRANLHAAEMMHCVAHGISALECEVHAQILETCLATKDFAPCQNLPQMSKTTQPNRTECRWVFDNWVCDSQ